jgi:alanyl-tRNA synthetase
VKKIIKAEEESFNATLDRGIELFEEIVRRLEKTNTKKIPGNEVFKLYDTFGFPIDLTNVMARERGYTIDEDGFNKLLNNQREKSRKNTKGNLPDLNIFASENIVLTGWVGAELYREPTEFTGYDELTTEANIRLHKKVENTHFIILDRSPFYVEAGGQIDDLGKLQMEANEIEVIDVTKIEDKTVHIVENIMEGIVTVGKKVTAEVNHSRRWDIMRNHSATHFLHAALRKVLGEHVHQAGSYVGPDHLRFDFTHFAKLADEELRDIEALVNDELRKNYILHHHRDIPFDEAKKMGALMFFGDKYGDRVNVVQFGDFTLEFCGGTHVKNSSEIGLFKILSESSIASGVRRIEAVTGAGVEKYIKDQLNIVEQHNERIEDLLGVKKKLEKEMAELSLKDKLGQLDHLLALSTKAKGIEIYKGKVIADNMDELKSFGDDMRNRMGRGVGVLVAQIDDKVGIVAVVSDDLIKEKKLAAGRIVSELAKIVGGAGGGRPHLATAGGKDIEHIPAAIGKVEEVVSSLI